MSDSSSPRLIFYDTETTGISSERDRIVEIAAYDATRGCEFVQLVNPGCPIPPEATAIHKISDEMVKEAPSFGEVSVQFEQFCAGPAILIAHNNDAFDQPFLRQEFERHGRAFPNWQFLDSLKWARRYRPDLPRHSLQFLREIYGVAANNAHRALDDVIVLHQVFKLMTDDLSAELIVALLNKPRLLRTMPFGKHQGMPLKKLPADYLKWLKTSGALDKEENGMLRASLQQLGIP